jgi:flagellar motor switch protein FliN/FliY
MADDKKNPWWESADGQKGSEEPKKDQEETSEEGAEEDKEDFISQTPPTIKIGEGIPPGMQAPRPGSSFFPTPPTMHVPGAQGVPQAYLPYPQAPGTFAGTPPMPYAMPQPYPQGLPVMPGTMPGAIPGAMPGAAPGTGPLGPDAAQYQTLKLSDLGAGVPYAPQGGNLGLLLDVPVPMTVVLGRTVMRIQEVLGLQPGSIVTLNSSDGEPVDLLIKDKLIAQGEVVVIEGNYGIKITKIVEPEQRVKDLG